jgi:Acetyltransferase (GNAT) domain
MGPRFDVPVLGGSLVRLEPLSVGHAPDLAQAAEEDRSAYGFTVVPRAGEVKEYLAAQLARDGLTCFAQVRVGDGAAVGCTAFCEPRPWPGRSDLRAIEVGWTWLAASAQGTGINAEAKFLLFSYAFETLGVGGRGRMADGQVGAYHPCRPRQHQIARASVGRDRARAPPGSSRRADTLALRDMGAGPGQPTRYLAGPEGRPVRPPRRSRAAALRGDASRGGGAGGGPYRGHREQYGCRTSGRGAWASGSARMARRARMGGSGRGAVGSGS